MTLAATILADLSDCFLSGRSEFEQSITINGAAVTAIVLDDFEEGRDARAPQLFVAAADVASYSAGAVVVADGTTYAAAGFYPDGAGGAIIQLQP